MTPTTRTRRSAEWVAEWTSSGDMEEDLALLRSLVEANDVEGARALAPRILERWPDSRRTQHWARVLEPAKATVLHGYPNESFRQEHDWLRRHAHEYPGCWIAVKGDRLIAADPSLRRVYELIRETVGATGALIHFQWSDAALERIRLPLDPREDCFYFASL